MHTLLEILLDPALETGKAKLLQPGDLSLRKALVGELREWRPAPQGERLRGPSPRGAGSARGRVRRGRDAVRSLDERVTDPDRGRVPCAAERRGPGGLWWAVAGGRSPCRAPSMRTSVGTTRFRVEKDLKQGALFRRRRCRLSDLRRKPPEDPGFGPPCAWRMTLTPHRRRTKRRLCRGFTVGRPAS